MKNIFFRFTAILSAACLLVMTSCGKNDSDSSAPAESESSVSAPSEGEFVTDPNEPDLGQYTVSSRGVKLYYDPEEYPPAVMDVLEKYFCSFADRDYESYIQCIQNDYITSMNAYLQKDYGYDLSTSFANQCDSLKEKAGGEFKVTRIKAELPEEDGIDNYFSHLDEFFASDFTGTVKNNSDKLYDMIFYVMVEAEGTESILISGFEIVFSEKDGCFYTFG